MEQIPQYIEDWITIIEEMNNDNTYKLAWGRAIIECAMTRKFKETPGGVEISFFDIGYNIMKYYWNQRFFFQLKQSPYKDKEPLIYKEVSLLIEKYKELSQSNIPKWYIEAEEVLIKSDAIIIKKTLNRITKILHKDVCWRFLRGSEKDFPLYQYHKEESLISLGMKEIELLQAYGPLLAKLFNYKWAALLEKYNYAPKIISKVTAMSFNKIQRASLVKYKEALLLEFRNQPIIDFYTGLPLKKEDISIDHVIPWSYMYSDDIWNLVITSKSNNSRKSNAIPSKEVIEKLKKRNVYLMTILDGTFHDELELAIKNHYVDSFYFGVRG